MKRRLVILTPYPKGEGPSQRFRFEQYLSLLEKDGFTIVHHSFLSEKTWKILYSNGLIFQKVMGVFKSFLTRFKVVFSLKKTDVIFIHREASHLGPPIFEWIIAKVLRKKYIFDFDDAIWLPNSSAANAKFESLKMLWKTKYLIKWAHKVSAGNEYLAEYARQFNPNVFIIPTTIDLVNHHNLITDYEHKPVVIGWTGTLTTMQYIEGIIPVLKDLEKSFEFKFRVISNKEPDFELKSLEYVEWNKSTEIKDLAAIQIGIMPLKDDVWAKGKCGFKALQYMALGIPSVISPVGVNNQIIEDKENGYLVSDLVEWKECLSRLLEDESLRMKIGKAGRETIKNQYSVTANYPLYLELLS